MFLRASPGCTASYMAYSAYLIYAAATLASFLLLWTLRKRVLSMDQSRLPCRKDAKDHPLCVSESSLKRDKKIAHVYIPVRSFLSADRLQPHLFLFFNSSVVQIALEKCD